VGRGSVQLVVVERIKGLGSSQRLPLGDRSSRSWGSSAHQ
jgi:hypothetical protein